MQYLPARSFRPGQPALLSVSTRRCCCDSKSKCCYYKSYYHRNLLVCFSVSAYICGSAPHFFTLFYFKIITFIIFQMILPQTLPVSSIMSCICISFPCGYTCKCAYDAGKYTVLVKEVAVFLPLRHLFCVVSLVLSGFYAFFDIIRDGFALDFRVF